jgi:hypothetical protein
VDGALGGACVAAEAAEAGEVAGAKAVGEVVEAGEEEQVTLVVEANETLACGGGNRVSLGVVVGVEAAFAVGLMSDATVDVSVCSSAVMLAIAAICVSNSVVGACCGC